MPNCARVIALIDMACFYVQVEERDDPSIIGKPAAVVQYNAWKGGGLIAVNYEARDKGVNRHIRGDDAKAACPEIILVKVPELRGKADLTKYRTAGSEVIKVLSEFPTIVERASVDEAYLDLTQMVEQRLSACEDNWNYASSLTNLNEEYLDKNFVLGYDSTQSWLESLREAEGMTNLADVKLAIGAEIVGEMRRAILDKTGFRCSAGIAHNKVLAKLVCGINKPNKQTVLPFGSVAQLYSTTPVKKVRNLGGKLGDILLEQMNIETMADLGKLSEKELAQVFGNKTGSWLYHLAQGDDDEAVTARQLPKSIGCNKNFTGPEALRKLDKIKHWIDQLSAEVVERIQKDFETNNRKSKSLTLHIRFEDGNQLSKSCGHPSYDSARMATDVYQVIEKIYFRNPTLPITSLGLIASKFEHELSSTAYHKIDSFFTKQPEKAKPSCTVTRPSDLDLTDQQIPFQIHRNPTTSALSADLSPQPGTSKSFFPPSTSKSSFQSESLQQRIGNPFYGVVKNTEDFFERMLQGEKLIAEKLNKFGESDFEDFCQGVFNRNSIQSESDKNILQLGRESTENFENEDSQIQSSQNQYFQIQNSENEDVQIQNPQNEKSSPKSPLTSAETETNAAATCTPSRKIPLRALSKKCDRCGQLIVIWDLEVHKDYHYAKDVQREINGLPPLAAAVDKNDKKTFEPVTLPKRIKPTTKRKGQRSTEDSRGGKRGKTAEGFGMRSIQSYFKPVNTRTTSSQGA